MNIGVERRGLRDESTSGFRHEKHAHIHSPTRVSQRGFTRVTEVLSKKDEMIHRPRRDGTISSPALDICSSTSAAIIVPPLRLKTLGI